MLAAADAPRMKRMLDNLQELKKYKEGQLKNKILSHRYLKY